MKEVDDRILDSIKTEFKTVRQISDELFLPYGRVVVRLKQMRKRNSVIFVQSNEPHIKGVKPLKYKQKRLI